MKKSIILSFLSVFTIVLLFNACNSGKLIGVPDPDEATYDKSRITVLLKERVTPEMLISSFEKYALEKNSPASRSENEWIFTWSAKVDADILLKDIQSSSMVKRAGFVKIMTQNN